MDVQSLVRRLESFGSSLPAVVTGLTPAEARAKPPNGAWSIVEIVNHLADEEVEDFRVRLELTLRDPSAPWPAIDPEAVCVHRKYNERELAESVGRFVGERAASVAWLRRVPATADWGAEHRHPSFGTISAGDLLASWAAHDALHLRQIAKRLYELAAADGAPHAVDYAGPWRA